MAEWLEWPVEGSGTGILIALAALMNYSQSVKR